MSWPGLGSAWYARLLSPVDHISLLCREDDESEELGIEEGDRMLCDRGGCESMGEVWEPGAATCCC